MAERRFTERETSQVLRKAAELQNGSGESGSTSLASESELKAAAREVGIDPAFVEQAIAQLSGGEPQTRSGFWGGPMAFDEEEAFPGRVDEESLEETVAELRRALGEAGTIQQRGQTWEWAGTGGGVLPATFVVRQVGDTVKMSASVNMGSLAGVYYALALIPLFIGTGVAVKLGRANPMLGGLAWIAWAVFVFWSTRSLYCSGARQYASKMKAVMLNARARIEESPSVPQTTEEEPLQQSLGA